MAQSEQAARELAERMEQPRREVRKPLHGNANDARMEQEERGELRRKHRWTE